jgi:hypothetical protein
MKKLFEAWWDPRQPSRATARNLWEIFRTPTKRIPPLWTFFLPLHIANESSIVAKGDRGALLSKISATVLLDLKLQLVGLGHPKKQ